ncbi:MAG: hypothetical protein Q9164_006955, partial [Protoblastenia rupestris]
CLHRNDQDESQDAEGEDVRRIGGEGLEGIVGEGVEWVDRWEEVAVEVGLGVEDCAVEGEEVGGEGDVVGGVEGVELREVICNNCWLVGS